MRAIIRLSLFFAALIYGEVQAQHTYGVKGFFPQTYVLSDSSPAAEYNGLKAGYEIRETEPDSKKSNQSRYKIYFYLTNTSNEAKIMYRNAGFPGHAGPISNNIAQFNCSNATGARLTNKMATMEMQPCLLEATVTDKDCSSGKEVQNSRQVNIGYWIKPGETVSKTYPMYVPQNEKPKISVTFYPEVANQTGSFIQMSSQPAAAPQNFVHIKNYSHSTYLNNQPGYLQCSVIENGWWSADWELVPVPGTENFNIRNRWKNTYLTADTGWLSDNPNSPGAAWSIQESSTTNMYYIKNANTNARLYVEHGQLKLSNSFISNEALSKWIIEK
ncbi:MAG: hypothetical protein U0X40_02705 [Ferruginibacter sp.]